MKEKIAALLKKYYEGKTSLEEERELKKLLLTIPGYEEEKQFFLGLEVMKSMEPMPRSAPKAKGEISLWQKVAAVMVVFIGLTWLFVDHQSKKEEALAYAQVMEAFSLIRENMEKGTTSLYVMKEMKHLNKTNELFNINEKEEQQ
jgi:hypothetical protein